MAAACSCSPSAPCARASASTAVSLRSSSACAAAANGGLVTVPVSAGPRHSPRASRSSGTASAGARSGRASVTSSPKRWASINSSGSRSRYAEPCVVSSIPYAAAPPSARVARSRETCPWTTVRACSGGSSSHRESMS